MPATVSAERRESIRERRLKVWRLRVVQKLTLAEIASAVGVSHGTVENDLASMRITRTDHLRRSQHTREASLDAAVEAMEECDAEMAHDVGFRGAFGGEVVVGSRRFLASQLPGEAVWSLGRPDGQCVASCTPSRELALRKARTAMVSSVRSSIRVKPRVPCGEVKALPPGPRNPPARGPFLWPPRPSPPSRSSSSAGTREGRPAAIQVELGRT